MAFYIKPPDGFGSLEKLRTSTLKRMSFLVDVVACPEATDFQALLEIGTSAVDSDCLIEGSRKDRMCHFFLRLICSQDTGLSGFFVQSETALFCHRFACMNCEELIHLLSSTHRFLLRRHKRQSSQEDDGFSSPQQDGRRKPFVPSMTLRAYSSYSDTLNNLLDVLNRILKSAGCSWEKAVTAYMKYDTGVFRVPFQHALCLVASRQVNLEQGEALVRFSDLHVVLAAMFESVVRNGIKIAQLISHRVLEDSRLHEIARDVTSLYYTRLDRYQWRGDARMRGDGTTIREWQLDQLHFFFPPCMANLHRVLRRKHRLRHFSRIQYTLFLKGIGLPVTDAIRMWEKEYSKPSHCHDDSGSKQAGCRHTWAKDGRRYTYNIRHLYGLEGSRTDYRPHSCRTIQEMQIGYGEDGGCPFKHFDDASLDRIMDIEEIGSEQRDRILYQRRNANFQCACKMYLSARKANLTRCGYGGQSSSGGGAQTQEQSSVSFCRSKLEGKRTFRDKSERNGAQTSRERKVVRNNEGLSMVKVDAESRERGIENCPGFRDASGVGIGGDVHMEHKPTRDCTHGAEAPRSNHTCECACGTTAARSIDESSASCNDKHGQKSRKKKARDMFECKHQICRHHETGNAMQCTSRRNLSKNISHSSKSVNILPKIGVQDVYDERTPCDLHTPKPEEQCMIENTSTKKRVCKTVPLSSPHSSHKHQGVQNHIASTQTNPQGSNLKRECTLDRESTAYVPLSAKVPKTESDEDIAMPRTNAHKRVMEVGREEEICASEMNSGEELLKERVPGGLALAAKEEGNGDGLEMETGDEEVKMMLRPADFYFSFTRLLTRLKEGDGYCSQNRLRSIVKGQ